MKELLYLKDTQLKQLIEKLFTSYRESFSDAKKTLDKYSIGIAHGASWFNQKPFIFHRASLLGHIPAHALIILVLGSLSFILQLG